MEQTPDGEIRAVERARLEHDDKDAMRVWLSHLDPEMPVALEATFGWPWVADLLEELGHPVHLGIGLILAHVIRAEIGEIERFPTFRHLASYADWRR